MSRASGRSRAVAPRRVEIVQPLSRNFRSGGHVYNVQLVRAARRRGAPFELSEVPASEAETTLGEHTISLRIWDSLFLGVLASGNYAQRGERGLLLHYLPSHDPTLDNAARVRFGRIETCALDAVSFVIATGRAHAALIRSTHPSTPVFVCEPGVSTAFLGPQRASARRSSGMLRLLTVANFTPAKGLVEILFALSRVIQIDWRWHVIGDETRDAAYTARFDGAVRQLGLAERIVRHGPLDEHAIARLMDESDLFVSASRFEAYGMALAEAAAARLPAVTTNVGAASFLYSHGSTGLISAVDDTDTFAVHLERLMRDATLRERFRQNLGQHRSRTWDDTLDDFKAAIATIV